MPRTNLGIVTRASALACLVGFSAACAGGTVRGADTPLSPAAAKVEVASQPKPGCKKLGTAQGIGEDLDEKVADGQATNAAKEEAVKLGGDTIVLATQTSDARAGSGGSVVVLTKTVDVYACGQ